MFINAVDSSRLAESVQRDYRQAADDYRQTRGSENGLSVAVRVGIAISGLIFLAVTAMQAAVT
jgi:hypothetical protein